MSALSLYFAHHVNTYGTGIEAAAMETLRREFPSPVWQIISPNRPDWQDGYRQFGMQFFIERCGECDACAYMPFPDGKVGAGVAKEVISFLERGAKVYRLDGAEITEAHVLPADLVLSVEETRARVRGPAQGIEAAKPSRPRSGLDPKDESPTPRSGDAP